MKIVHRASLIRADGGVSALCYRRPRAIRLGVASWTLIDSAVTCPKCRSCCPPPDDPDEEAEEYPIK